MVNRCLQTSTCDPDTLLENNDNATKRNNEGICCIVPSQRMLNAYLINISTNEQQIEKIEVRFGEKVYFKEKYACEYLTIEPRNNRRFSIYLPDKVGTLHSTDFTLSLDVSVKDLVTEESSLEQLELNYQWCE